MDLHVCGSDSTATLTNPIGRPIPVNLAITQGTLCGVSVPPGFPNQHVFDEGVELFDDHGFPFGTPLPFTATTSFGCVE